MKPIRRHKQFKKNFLKRITPNDKLFNQFESKIVLFMSGERGYPLNDHPLSGNLAGKRAFSVNGDLRVVYEEHSDHIIFLDIGTHNQVYG